MRTQNVAKKYRLLANPKIAMIFEFKVRKRIAETIPERLQISDTTITGYVTPSSGNPKMNGIDRTIPEHFADLLSNKVFNVAGDRASLRSDIVLVPEHADKVAKIRGQGCIRNHMSIIARGEEWNAVLCEQSAENA